MKSSEIRQQFLDFFASKEHKIVPSSPIVNKGDPTLMFTNAGMNQFKDYFLGNQSPPVPRIADTQKCLRVSGKHNDLEEVGIDSYHHTMFEMLGNWSFGDYFKKEAIAWAWELLHDVFKINKDDIYITVFEGDKKDGLEADEEAVEFWKEWVSPEHILYFDRKDNFWEMGASGPCGPCSEIHVDIRTPEEKAKQSGKELVNMDHPQVIEIWNLVFIQFNRKADGSLENLPEKHIDTGMGFERLCMILQGKTSNYDSDVFTPFIQFIEKHSGVKYTSSYDLSAKSDIAMRVVADHLRAVTFTIADGQLPSNTGAGYVIRRILRRAVRYYYSFLDVKEPLLYKMIPLLVSEFGSVFPELKKQQDMLTKVILGEEKAFLNTLEKGINRFNSLDTSKGKISGADAFELFDTFGFPIDLTRLMASENGVSIDEAGFKKALAEQKERSRADAKKTVGDWTELQDDPSVLFVGYDSLEVDDAQVVKYRTVKVKDKDQYQIVLNKTPFYAESGGQHGDVGLLIFGEEKIGVLDTQKENDLIVHVVKKFPTSFEGDITAQVHKTKRAATEKNHTAAHLLHSALHQVLGAHALQKGQDLGDKKLRFDFSHFSKVTEEELASIETMVNQKIIENIALDESRDIPLEEAKAKGAMMLFGEKYGETVRVITFDPEFSSELCGGTHVNATGEIGLFKILSESGVAAGIRRIEGITGEAAYKHVNAQIDDLQNIKGLFKNTPNVYKSVSDLQEENKQLKKQVEEMMAAQAQSVKQDLLNSIQSINGVNLISYNMPIQNTDVLKDLAYQLEREVGDAVIVFGCEVNAKPQLMVTISKNIVEEKSLDAGKIIRELAKEIRGGGGGQAFFATAGGSDVAGLDKAIAKAKELV
jgi:alanyl-tRNA synthetase